MIKLEHTLLTGVPQENGFYAICEKLGERFGEMYWNGEYFSYNTYITYYPHKGEHVYWLSKNINK